MTDAEKLVEMALKSGAVNHFVQGLPDRYAFSLGELAAFRAAIIASLCMGAEPVAEIMSAYAIHWRGSDPIAPTVRKHGLRVGSHLYADTTVAALKALVTELEDFIVSVGQDLHHERVADWYPEGANNAALAMSESMRLIGNRCADIDAALTKGQP